MNMNLNYNIFENIFFDMRMGVGKYQPEKR